MTPTRALEAIDGHFRSSQLRDGRWGYRIGMNGKDSMTCAGLMGLTIAASRPSLAERQTARVRGDARRRPRISGGSQGCRPRRPPLRSPFRHLLPVVARACLRGARIAIARWIRLVRSRSRILIEVQQDDGGWPHGQWGRLPATCLALLFLRKANLAFEIDRVLRLPGSGNDFRVVKTGAASSAETDGAAPNATDPAAPPTPDAPRWPKPSA